MGAIYLVARLLRRIKSLEKELAGADAEISSLNDQLTDYSCTQNSAQKAFGDIARVLGIYEYCEEVCDDIVHAICEEIQTNIDDKLIAEKKVHWLATQCSVFENAKSPSEWENMATKSVATESLCKQ